MMARRSLVVLVLLGDAIAIPITTIPADIAPADEQYRNSTVRALDTSCTHVQDDMITVMKACQPDEASGDYGVRDRVFSTTDICRMSYPLGYKGNQPECINLVRA